MADDAPTEPGPPLAAGSHTTDQQAEPPPTLYRRVLGADWERLDPAVRRAHDTTVSLQATGTFAITRSSGWFYGLVLDLARVPPASAGAGVSLLVQRDGPGERWLRTFGTQPLQSRQYATPGGLLAEQFGPWEFWFWLGAEDGGLRFRHVRQFLRLGPLRLPLPHWAAPHIAARERAGCADNETALSVRVTTSTATLLFAYAGVVRWSPAGTAAGSPTDQEAPRR
jgi:hypothetical protein